MRIYQVELATMNESGTLTTCGTLVFDRRAYDDLVFEPCDSVALSVEQLNQITAIADEINTRLPTWRDE